MQYVLNGDCRSNVGVFGLGKESTSCLASLIRGKTVRVEWVKKDQYGRVLGIVFLPNAAAAPAKS